MIFVGLVMSDRVLFRTRLLMEGHFADAAVIVVGIQSYDNALMSKKYNSVVPYTPSVTLSICGGSFVAIVFNEERITKAKIWSHFHWRVHRTRLQYER